MRYDEIQVTGTVRVVVRLDLEDWFETERAVKHKLMDLERWPAGITVVLDVAGQRLVSHELTDWVRARGRHLHWRIEADHPATVQAWIDAIRHGRRHLSLVESA